MKIRPRCYEHRERLKGRKLCGPICPFIPPRIGGPRSAKSKKRADGRYMTQIYLGRNENGKKQYKSIYAKSTTQLKEKEAELRMHLGRGLDVLSQRDSFAQWADDWLWIKESAGLSDHQMDNYRHSVRIWKDMLNGLEIGQVRADDVERGLLALVDDGYAARTVNFYRSTISQIMRRAVGRVIASSPVDLVRLTQPGQEAEKNAAP